MNNNRLLSPRPPPVTTKQAKAKTSEKTKKGAVKRELSPKSPTPDSNAVKNGADSPHARRKTVVQKLRTPEDSAKALSSSPEGREVSQLKSPRDNGKEKIGTVRGATLVSDDEE